MIVSDEPAFPQERMLPCGSHEQCEGLTIRDYFAAKAMQVFLRNLPPHDIDAPYSIWAGDAYEMADAMLKVRAQ